MNWNDHLCFIINIFGLFCLSIDVFALTRGISIKQDILLFIGCGICFTVIIYQAYLNMANSKLQKLRSRINPSNQQQVRRLTRFYALSIVNTTFISGFLFLVLGPCSSWSREYAFSISSILSSLIPLTISKVF
jgi:hypothetical protein